MDDDVNYRLELELAEARLAAIRGAADAFLDVYTGDPPWSHPDPGVEAALQQLIEAAGEGGAPPAYSTRVGEMAASVASADRFYAAMACVLDGGGTLDDVVDAAARYRVSRIMQRDEVTR